MMSMYAEYYCCFLLDNINTVLIVKFNNYPFANSVQHGLPIYCFFLIECSELIKGPGVHAEY